MQHLTLLTIFTQQVAGAVLRHAPLQLSRDKLASMPLHLFQSDCSMRSRRTPGSGMLPAAIKPFETVYKDGFYEVDCVDDDMFTHGDKFGDNKHEYTLGGVSGVSIVHYSMHVKREDMEPMTHEVCFSFCRTVPNMTFFGIRNGHECYCSPFYRSVEGDDSMCDSVCDGNQGTMCGSKTKSTVFGMHSCTTMAEDMSDAIQSMGDVKMGLMARANYTAEIEGAFTFAGTFQTLVGLYGEPVTADLLQDAKVQAGLLEEVGRVVNQTLADMSKYEVSAAVLTDFQSSQGVTAAEDMIAKMMEITAKGEELAAKMDAMIRKYHPPAQVGDYAKQYYSTMFFVDKEFIDHPAVCSGETTGLPLLGDLNTCSRACDEDVHSCVGFDFYSPGPGMPGLCFLFSKLKTITFFRGCANMTLPQVAPTAQCYAKLSKFEGTTLKPDASGKCEKCLKAATPADRCWY